MDILDSATAVEELHRDLAMRNRDRGPVIAETGYCLNCEAPAPAGRRWCDAACRDDWQRAQRRY
jgi:hypothetical protein